MSKIFHSGSGVSFESVRFQDLESVHEGSDFFFAPAGFANVEPETKKNDLSAEVNESLFEGAPSQEKEVDLKEIEQEAFTRGKAAGFVEAEERLHETVQAFSAGLEQVNNLRKSLLERSKKDMTKLIMAIVQKVIQSEVREKEEIIVSTVEKTLQSAIQSDEYYIKVHPEDLETVAEKEPLFLACMKGLRDIHFIADPSVSRGGCLAESKAGEVDSRIETQLNEIYDHLLQTILLEDVPE